MLKLAKVLDHAPERLVELDGRLVSDQVVDARDVWHAARHVFETGLVRLLVRDLDDRRAAAGHLLDLLGELRNRDLSTVADIEDLTDRAGFVDQGYHSPHHIAHVSEAP